MATALEQARGLSSGTIARLIGSSHYEAIDAAHSAFILWLTTISPDQFEDWHEAWAEFSATAERAGY